MATVFVIEDDPDVNEIWVEAIRAGGHHAVGLTSTTGAAEAYAREQPDLIVLDIVMPLTELNGIEFLSRLWESAARRVPVIIVSGIADAINPDVARHLGVRASLMKPVGSRELRTAIEEVLRAEGPVSA
jgi:DNA-binding response OmpR family regulator